MLWSEFVQQCLDFLDIANKLNDPWTWVVKNNLSQCEGSRDLKENEAYLRYNHKLHDDVSGELIQLEYHVVYSISYQVPVLYVQGHMCDGKVLSLEEMWKLFKLDTMFKREEILSMLTQMEHPILYKPYLCIHPCRTAELLAQTPHSDNFILTYLSVMGPYVLLKLESMYGNVKGSNTNKTF